MRLADLLERPSATRVAIVAVGRLGLAFALYQLAEPDALYGVTEYDDGPQARLPWHRGGSARGPSDYVLHVSRGRRRGIARHNFAREMMGTSRGHENTSIPAGLHGDRSAIEVDELALARPAAENPGISSRGSFDDRLLDASDTRLVVPPGRTVHEVL